MKYNQPFGISDPNAAYINGNPTTGTMGSIPPAESIEYDQREIVALIAATGQTPANSDLAQLLKAIKYVDVLNAFKLGTNGGNAFAWSMTGPALPVMPPPTGTMVWFKPGIASVVGGTTFSLNGSAPKPVVCCDLTPIGLGDIVASAWLVLLFDGNNWQVVAGSTRQFGTLPTLHAAADWYVNKATGLDTYDGTAPTHVSGNVGPFQTLQRAADEVIKYNMNGYNQTIHVADGVYTSVKLHPTNGSGIVILQGNDVTPSNVAVQTSAANSHAISQDHGTYVIRGVRVAAVGTGVCDGITTSGGTTTLLNCQFGACTRYHICAANNASMGLVAGTFTIESGATCAAHLACTVNSAILVDIGSMPMLSVLGSTNVSSAFLVSTALSSVQLRYASVGGAANIHGQQYSATGNALIYMLGGGNPPGDVAGAVGTGGQYVP